MTKNEIIAELYQSEKFNTTIEGLIRRDFQLIDDFKQEISIMLLEKSDELINDLHKENKLHFYVIRIMLNQLNSKNSKFYYKYKKDRHLFIGNMQVESKDTEYEESEYEEFNILRYCNQNRLLTWYEINILSIYYKLGEYKKIDEKQSLRSIEKEYGIDHCSIRLTLKGAVEKIREHLNK